MIVDRRRLILEFSKNMDAMARLATSRHIQDRRPRSMPPHGQMAIMFAVAHHGSQSIKQLAERFGMTSSAATQLVNHLVRAKFIKRKEDSKDRRKITVQLTPKGKQIIGRARKFRLKKISALFEPLSDLELLQLQKIQAKIISHWQKICTKP